MSNRPPGNTDSSGARPRHHLSRAESAGSGYYAPAESLILPDGAVGEETAEYLEEFAGTHQHHHGSSGGNSAGQTNDDSEEEEEDEVARRRALPWWKRPSPWWLLCAVPFSAVAKSSTLAPKVEVYTMLACRVHKPDIYNSSYTATPAINDSDSVVPEMLRSLRGDADADTVHLPVLRSSNSPQDSTLYVHAQNRAARKPATPCASDPTVQAAVARLSAGLRVRHQVLILSIVVETSTGVLSLLTTGWWGAFSDRHGRATILAICLVGLLISDFNFINVYFFSESLPGNYWFLLSGAILEGLLGGFSTAVAAQHAYIAETSTDATRARYLSLNLGLLFTGMAFGPTLGSLLIRASGKTISVFYLSTFVHVIYAFLIFFGLPEPLSKRRMKMSKLRYEEELRAGAQERRLGGLAGFYAKARRLFKFLSPLSIFLPNFVDDAGRNPLKRKERDWNLSLVAVSYGFTISIMATFPYIFQYANATFGWTSETLGYWLSIVGAGRAIWLTLCLPIAIKLLKPKPMIIEVPAPSHSTSPTDSEQEPLLSTDQNEGRSASPPPRRNTIKKEIHSPRFELGVARLSLVIDIIAYAVMAILSSEAAFGIFGILGAMGIGFSPAMQTLALALYARRGGQETGRLFGALSVVQALSSQIIGPAAYGFVYVRTVATFSRAIFFAALTCILVSLILMSFVRLPRDKDLENELLGIYQGGDLEEEPGQRAEGVPAPER